MDKKYFYDAHMHAFDLSHPNLTAFLNRVEINKLLTLNSIFGSIIGPLLKIFSGKKIKKIKNLLSFMDNDIGSMFLILEHELKNSDLYQDGKIKIGGESYDKIILTPLIIDFGYKGKEYNKGIVYNKPPRKPIRSQINYLFTGIRFYLENEIIENNKDGNSVLKIKELNGANIEVNKEIKLFEIYPFMGINPASPLYPSEKFKGIINKYFDNYEADHKKFYKKFGTHPTNVEKLKEFSFLGIKVYPPMNFNPSKYSSNFTYLLNKCIEKNIPLMTHCSDGGFLINKKFRNYSSPHQWNDILSDNDYQKLKVCFAHFGNQSKKKLLVLKRRKWEKKLLEFIANPELNVYTDISCMATDNSFYKHLKKCLHQHPTIRDRILFGTDFSINLLWTESYSSYYKTYSENLGSSDNEMSNLFGSINPTNYLFN